MNDATSPLLFSTANVALASGAEPGSSDLTGPGLAGLMTIIPSIPDSPPEAVCPVQAHASIKIRPKTIDNVGTFTRKLTHYEITRQAGYWRIVL